MVRMGFLRPTPGDFTSPGPPVGYLETDDVGRGNYSRLVTSDQTIEGSNGNGGLFGIVERIGLAHDGLAGFVAFACDKKCVAGAEGIDAAQDGLGAVADVIGIGTGGKDCGGCNGC